MRLTNEMVEGYLTDCLGYDELSIEDLKEMGLTDNVNEACIDARGSVVRYRIDGELFEIDLNDIDVEEEVYIIITKITGKEEDEE